MRAVVLFPFAAELKALLGLDARLSLRLDGSWPTVELPEWPDWLFVVCGQGKVEAALCVVAFLTRFPTATFVLGGSATALDPGIEVGSWVLANECLEWDFGESALRDHKPRFQQSALGPSVRPPGVVLGCILSADRNWFSPEEKKQLFLASGARAAAWEGAGFHRGLKRSGAAGFELRRITEAASDDQVPLSELQKKMRAPRDALMQILSGLVT